MRTCKSCKISIEDRNRQAKYCFKCLKARRVEFKRLNRTGCRFCGNKDDVKSGICAECYEAINESKAAPAYKEKPCHWCNTLFIPTSNNQINCSEECSRKTKNYNDAFRLKCKAAYPVDERKEYPPYPVKHCIRPVGRVHGCSGKYLPRDHKQEACLFCEREQKRRIG